MKTLFTVKNALVGLVTVIFFLPHLAVAGGEQCSQDGYLNILTINILFSEIENRDQRLNNIATFAKDNEVDVILLQEVVGGLLVGTANSAKDLQDKLESLGETYELRTAFETGLPGLLAVANATLSRCDILYKLVKRLPRASEIEFRGRNITLPRNVLMTRLRIPGYGKISVYNTHKCAYCSVSERGEQLAVALNFIRNVEWFLPGSSPVLYGGDFNIDRFREDQTGRDSDLYNLIIDDEGFRDAYATSQTDPLDELCNELDEHCTFGVTELSKLNDPKQRIDYVFDAGFGMVDEARVVFTTQIPGEPTVSDHAGVFVRLALPGS